MHILERLLAAVAPHSCIGCGAEGHLLCAACQQSLPLVPPRCYRCGRVGAWRTCSKCQGQNKLYAVAVATVYDGHAQVLVHRCKFERARAAAIDMAHAMPSPLTVGALLVVHVPTATARIRLRGYDQAQLMARAYAGKHALPLAAPLVRIGQQRQVGMSGLARRKQLRSAFRVARPQQVTNKTVVLIDDVITTGSTLEAAALALRAAGAKRVVAVAFAAA